MWSAQNYSWIVMLIFTPLVLDLVGGPKNGTVICLFSWAVCSSLFIMTWFVRTEPAKWACSIINGVVSGITAPLAFTGTEVYTERAAVLLAREEFAEAKAAIACAQELHGKAFDGRAVVAAFTQAEDFAALLELPHYTAP